NSEDYNFNLSMVDPKQIDNGKILSFLKTGDESETKYFIEEYFSDLGHAAKSQIFRQYIVMNIYFAISEFITGLGVDKSDVDQISTIESQTGSLSDTIAYLSEQMRKAILIRDSKTSDKAGSIVSEVKEIVKENFADFDLSLGMIASKVNFSPNHLSMLFSHETGQTLIKYLTDFRLNKAKELLRCTNLKSSEISEKVGYSDPHYFSYLFKKTYGVTPTMYREGKETN
ncbi:MAG: AraC family transcriptional regulator, partial [Lachnospiraceae bacterium]|nr:AraC family transcriptional regulator [Lachnospiraceae bacterium]